VGPISTNVKV